MTAMFTGDIRTAATTAAANGWGTGIEYNGQLWFRRDADALLVRYDGPTGEITGVVRKLDDEAVTLVRRGDADKLATLVGQLA
ncbi:Uncharacterised protein [Mycobacteroides abscessus subsp. abscessus]|nr:Uncharacterised protein [Mycobacteroides abscessus subsp. abscessus]